MNALGKAGPENEGPNVRPENAEPQKHDQKIEDKLPKAISNVSVIDG